MTPIHTHEIKFIMRTILLAPPPVTPTEARYLRNIRRAKHRGLRRRVSYWTRQHRRRFVWELDLTNPKQHLIYENFVEKIKDEIGLRVRAAVFK